MNLLTVIRIALRALRVNGLRSSLTILGIIIGVGAVITMISVGAGAQARVEEEIYLMGSRLIIIRSSSVSSSGARLGFGSKRTITEDDAYAIQREVAAVQAVGPWLSGSGQVLSGHSNWSTAYYGVSPGHFEVWNWEVAAGRGIDQSDVKNSAKIAVLGETVAWNLFGDADPIGQVVRINKVPLTVIGVTKRKGQSWTGKDRDNHIHMPISTARSRVLGAAQSKRNFVHGISVKVREDASMTDAGEEIQVLLRERHRLQPGQDDDFILQNRAAVQGAREESTRIMTLLLAAVASVSLLVGGIGVMNIMLVSVTERKREIGLRMAVGARGRDIFAQFLVEALTLAFIGGLLGIAAGIAGSYAIAHFMDWRIALRLESIALAIGFTSAIGIIFGLYPARKASRLMPIEALRYE